ncbi:MAG: hypothetical protein J7639_11785 [Paenibacillaceae bacterium]|uniref:hypothetical protein n=1 Tax=Paenibacillus cymbidii TaxID=1639034 RepID=UPI001436CA04|nr:hypothetical protein [Paenibacillus cymbidii]MBO9606628.1 hypothetical protein [Paenibacillaceae bacterium]
MYRWWCKYRYTIKGVLFPLICFQFVRTLLLPNPFDVMLLFLFFLAYLGFLLEFY